MLRCHSRRSIARLGLIVLGLLKEPMVFVRKLKRCGAVVGGRIYCEGAVVGMMKSFGIGIYTNMRGFRVSTASLSLAVRDQAT